MEALIPKRERMSTDGQRNGSARQNLIRDTCYHWVREYRPDIYDKIVAAAYEKFPLKRTRNGNSENAKLAETLGK